GHVPLLMDLDRLRLLGGKRFDGGSDLIQVNRGMNQNQPFLFAVARTRHGETGYAFVRVESYGRQNLLSFRVLLDGGFQLGHQVLLAQIRLKDLPNIGVQDDLRVVRQVLVDFGGRQIRNRTEKSKSQAHSIHPHKSANVHRFFPFNEAKIVERCWLVCRPSNYTRLVQGAFHTEEAVNLAQRRKDAKKKENLLASLRLLGETCHPWFGFRIIA